MCFTIYYGFNTLLKQLVVKMVRCGMLLTCEEIEVPYDCYILTAWRLNISVPNFSV